MHDYQQVFIQTALRKQALRFGNFQLKSGRMSPYFFNAGCFDDGSDLKQVSQCYAALWQERQIACDCLFGPAYKGIPLACALAMTLAHQGLNMPWCFNRKEAKNHGEGGYLVGAPLHGKVVLVDDVISSGKAIRESAALVRDAGAEIAAVLVMLDRQERGQTYKATRVELEDFLGAPVYPIVTLENLLQHLQMDESLQQHAPAVAAYQKEFAGTC